MLFSIVADAGAASNQDVFPWDTPQPKVAASKMTSGGAHKWAVVETSDRYTLYVDSNNVRKDHNIVQLAIMYDLKTIEEAAGKPFGSVTGWAEYDCDQRQARTLRAMAYSGSMGESAMMNGGDPNVALGRAGTVNRIAEPGKWMPIGAASAQEVFWNYACSK